MHDFVVVKYLDCQNCRFDEFTAMSGTTSVNFIIKFASIRFHFFKISVTFLFDDNVQCELLFLLISETKS